MGLVINHLKKLLQFFEDCKNSNNFFLRERLYVGKPGTFIGLVHYHEFVEELLDRIESPFHEKFLLENQNEFENMSTELEEFLELVPYFVEKDNERINKLIRYLEEEISKLELFIDKGLNYDPSVPIAVIDKIKEIHELIDDNFYQLSRKHSIPVPYKRKILSSTENYEHYLFGSCFRNSLLISDEDVLILMGVIITKIREKFFSSKQELYKYLNLYLTLTLIFSRNDTVEKLGLDQNDVKQDVEHYINLNRLDWLVKLHQSFYEVNQGEELPINFAHQLYKLSRDSKEEFLWTMLRIAREQNNLDLEKVSVDFASLAATLLSLVHELKIHGLEDLAKAIKNVGTINALDAIDDLSELYRPEEINVEQLIKAMSRKLENLKEFSYQILQMDDLASNFKLYFSATGLNRINGSDQSLFSHIKSLGIRQA